MSVEELVCNSYNLWYQSVRFLLTYYATIEHYLEIR